MRRWLSSTSRCGLYVFRWPTYTDIYWLVLTFLSCNFAEPRMIRKRSIDPASNFHREGGGGGGLYWKTRPLCRRSPSFPNFLLDSLLCPTINPFLSSFFFFFFVFSQVEHDFSFSKFEKDERDGRLELVFRRFYIFLFSLQYLKLKMVWKMDVLRARKYRKFVDVKFVLFFKYAVI